MNQEQRSHRLILPEEDNLLEEKSEAITTISDLIKTHDNWVVFICVSNEEDDDSTLKVLTHARPAFLAMSLPHILAEMKNLTVQCVRDVLESHSRSEGGE